MRKIELNEIEVAGTKYPLYCDMNVLQEIQDSGISINEFERKILGFRVAKDEKGDAVKMPDGTLKLTKTNPDIKTIIQGLTYMINEGLAVKEAQSKCKHTEVSFDELMITNDVPFDEVSSKIHSEFNRCFSAKKK